MPPPLKHWLHIAGGGLGLLGVAFVAKRLHTYSAHIDITLFDTIAWLLIGALILAYGTANVFLAQAWRQILIFLEVRVRLRWAIRAYGLSQLAKYLPGNIFHLASRQALGMAVGLPARALAKSAIWELGLIAVVGAIFGVLVVPLLWPEFPMVTSVVAFSLVAAGVVAGLNRFFSPSASAAFAWQLLFLAVSGAVFAGTLALAVPTPCVLPPLPALCGAFVIAWLAGLVTPGAPAGIGVREMVLLFLLGQQIAQADLLLAVVLGRGVTVLGDLIFFFAASALKTIRKPYGAA